MGSLECGGDRLLCTTENNDDDDDEESVCFSEAEDEGSCYSQFYSTASGSRRVSSVVDSDCSVDFENEFKILFDRVCRICQMSVGIDDSEYGIGIELGCCCKNDLAAAHLHCAQNWFRIKGNMICEICNSTARNVVSPSYDIESPEHVYEPSVTYDIESPLHVYEVGPNYDFESPRRSPSYDFESLNVSELISLSPNAASARASTVVGLSYERSTLSANADLGRVSNVVGPSYDVESQPTTLSANADSEASSIFATLPLGHWFVNFVLVCICFAFVAWLSNFRLPQ